MSGRGIDSHQYDQAVMMRFALCSLLALQLIHSVFSASVGLPLEFCPTQFLLSGNPVQDVTLQNPTQFSQDFPGTPGYPAVDFSDTSLDLDYSLLNGPVDVTGVSFSIFVQDAQQDTDILSILDSDGQNLITVSILSGELQIYANVTSSNNPIPIEDLNKTLLQNQWNEVTILLASSFAGLPLNYYSGVNGQVSGLTFEVDRWDFTDATFKIIGGASVACLYVSGEVQSTTYNSIIDNSPCKSYEANCPPDANEADFTAIPPSCCDEANTASCQNVTFTGTGLDAAGGYNCSVQYFKLNSSGELVEDGSLVTFAAVSVTETEAVCILNGDATAVVTLSSSGTDHVSATVKVLPTQCINCTDDFVCNPTGNGCLIDGDCLSPNDYVPGNSFQICDPQADPLGPTLVPLVNVSLNNCGEARGVSLNATGDESNPGFSIEEGALSALSSAITLNYAAKLPYCKNTMERRPLFRLSSGILISQDINKVVVNLTFTDPATGDVEERSVEIDAGNGRCRARGCSFRRRDRIFTPWYKTRCNNRCACAVIFSLRHDPQTGETTLTVNQMQENGYGWEPTTYTLNGTLGYLLKTDGVGFINEYVPSCITITNDLSDEIGNDEQQTDHCFRYICRKPHSKKVRRSLGSRLRKRATKKKLKIGLRRWLDLLNKKIVAEKKRIAEKKQEMRERKWKKWAMCDQKDWKEQIRYIPRGPGLFPCTPLHTYFGRQE